MHRFEVGQSVVPAHPSRQSHNVYFVVRQLPDTSFGPQYWIQGATSGFDCIVCESDIEAADGHEKMFPSADRGPFGSRP